MNDPSEPSIPAPRPTDRPTGRERLLSPAGTALAGGWLVVPAVQYVWTVVRTQFKLGEAEAGVTPPPWVEWDLTPAYVLLVLLTLLYVSRSYLAGRAGRTDDTLLDSRIAGESGGAA